MLEHRTTGIEGAKQIDVDYGFESIGRHTKRGRRKISRSATDDEIYFAVLVPRCLNCRGKSVVLTNVRGMARSFYTGFTNLGSGCIELFLGAPDQCYVRAMF